MSDLVKILELEGNSDRERTIDYINKYDDTLHIYNMETARLNMIRCRTHACMEIHKSMAKLDLLLQLLKDDENYEYDIKDNDYRKFEISITHPYNKSENRK